MRAALVIAFLLAGCASKPPPAAVTDLAPNGTLRAAINVGNAVLAARGSPEPSGVSVDAGRLMVINQAMASQRGREAGARYVREFVEDVKASGFVAQALARHKQTAAVAPPGDAR